MSVRQRRTRDPGTRHDEGGVDAPNQSAPVQSLSALLSR